MLQEQAKTRVPELVPIRHARMTASPFAFYRGAAAVMAADLATTPNSGLRVQICGDAHLANFGGFAAPDRTIVFDVNDFDETAARAVGVGREATRRELRDRGTRPRVRRRRSAGGSSSGSCASYRDAMREFAASAQPRPLVHAARRERRLRPVPAPADGRGAASASRRTSRRPGARTASRRSPSSPPGSTARCGSSATRR